MAAVGLTETLLTQQLVDELTETRSSTHLECIGQGLANIVCGVFGGLGGCAMIGQTMVNVKSGGAKRLSGITCSLFIMLFIVVASPIIEAVPLAALVGCARFPHALSSYAIHEYRMADPHPSDCVFGLCVSCVELELV